MNTIQAIMIFICKRKFVVNFVKSAESSYRAPLRTKAVSHNLEHSISRFRLWTIALDLLFENNFKITTFAFA